MNKVKKFLIWYFKRHNFRMHNINTCNLIPLLLWSIITDFCIFGVYLLLVVFPIMVITLWYQVFTGFIYDGLIPAAFIFSFFQVALIMCGGYKDVKNSFMFEYLSSKFCRRIDWYSNEEK